MKFRILSERLVHKSRVFRLKTKTVILPNGRKTTLDIIEHPGAVAIVPLFPNGDVLLIRQFRLAAKGFIHEIPAGTLEPGESPAATARREIVEETGYRARSMKKVCSFLSAPGFLTEVMHVYLAQGLSPASAEKDADEVIEPFRVSYAKALAMIRKGKIRDAKSIVGLLLVRDTLRKRRETR